MDIALAAAVGAASVIAGAVASIAGFGIGSLLTPILLGSFAAADAVAIVAIPHALATTIRWLRLRRDVHRPTFRQFGVASALGGLGGAALQAVLASDVLTAVLGGLLVLAGSAELAGRRLPLPDSRAARFAGGVASGFFGGLVGNQGGIRTAALVGFALPPRALVATATASALLVDAARVPIYLVTARDAIADHLGLVAIASAGVTVGTLVGVPVLGRISERTFRRSIGALLVLLGLTLLASVGRFR